MKLLKNLFILILLSVFHLASFAQDDDFNKVIYQVIDGFNQQDASKINTLVNKDVGLIFLFRRGAELGSLGIVDKIDFDHPVPEYYPFDMGLIDPPKKLSYAKLPLVFDCDKEAWSKTKKGIYYNDKGSDKLFTTIIDFSVKYGYMTINANMYKKYQNIEQNSRRIIGISSTGYASIIFYLTKMNNKWYLTIIDRVSDDCSA